MIRKGEHAASACELNGEIGFIPSLVDVKG
jgi:hypothetical protein